MPRHPDPELENRILCAASRLWARGGEKALTMRAVAKAAGTTTPTVYERYRDRDDILLALRLQTRSELFAALSRTRSLREAFERHLEFALRHSHAYEVLFDAVGKPPSLHEPWPTFNLIRERVAKRLGGNPARTYPAHAGDLVADARHRHAHHPRRIRGRLTHANRSRLPGCSGWNTGHCRPLQGPQSFRAPLAHDFNSGRGETEQRG